MIKFRVYVRYSLDGDLWQEETLELNAHSKYEAITVVKDRFYRYSFIEISKIDTI